MSAAIEDCIDAVVAALEPPPRLTVSEWADQFRRLSPEASAEPGEFRTSRAPYQKAILDALGPDSPYARVVFMSSSQVGKTEILNSFVGYIIDQDPGPILVVQPRVEDGESWSRDRLATMIRDTPALHGKVADVRSRDADNRVLHKRFQGGSITIAGANSPAGLAARSIRYALCDEVDRFPVSAGTEGDPISLVLKRCTTWWNSKVFIISTPTVKDASRIESWWNRSNQQTFWVPCPECGQHQALLWSGVVWPADHPEDAQYRCSRCKALIPPHKKPWMLARGEWRAANPKSKIAGFFVNQLYSPWKEWGATAQEFLEAKAAGPEALRAFLNTALGELWQDETAGHNLEPSELIGRRERYAADEILPAGVVLVTAGADVQDDRIELEIVGWGRGEESWSLCYAIIPGSPQQSDVWDLLDQLLLMTFNHPCGREMTISAACVDAGFLQPVVQNFCNQRNHRRIFPTKGAPGPGRPVWPRAASKSKDERPLWIVGVDGAKEAIATRLKIPEHGPGYCHFPEGDMYDATYFAQLTAETCKIKYLKGFAHREWSKKIGARNEALDCRVYAYAALQSLVMSGFRLSHQADQIEELMCQPEGKQQAAPQHEAPQSALPPRAPWIPRQPNWIRGSGK